MSKFKITKCEIEGLYILEPKVFCDDRGYFMETYNQNDFDELGLNLYKIMNLKVKEGS